jgi:hypothetical protein
MVEPAHIFLDQLKFAAGFGDVAETGGAADSFPKLKRSHAVA